MGNNTQVAGQLDEKQTNRDYLEEDEVDLWKFWRWPKYFDRLFLDEALEDQMVYEYSPLNHDFMCKCISNTEQSSKLKNQLKLLNKQDNRSDKDMLKYIEQMKVNGPQCGVIRQRRKNVIKVDQETQTDLYYEDSSIDDLHSTKSSEITGINDHLLCSSFDSQSLKD
ncbi:UNKNOWN [Stylonychia lemnae]|uniref:Uncharacterized protein n=1 Tax=Stylonychia lemnae TaxID=5949 RepID=A0A078AM58_STYLE|nr:UNKNOWN [Stylonychia lemnae]|eukprot:CDW81913.1 UNKNOWN [Stylonychia lemnae]